MFKSVRSSLHQAQGRAIFEAARSDFLAGTIDRQTKASRAFTLLCRVILATPYVFALLGATLLVLDFPNLVTLFLGAICLGIAWVTRPRKDANTAPTLRRNDCPRTFALVDDICAAMDAPRIDGIHILPDMNAYMATFQGKDGQEKILGIGAPFWMALSHQERIATLGHEIAHLVNNDPARTGLAARAIQTLDAWHGFLYPPQYTDEYGNPVAPPGGLLSAIFLAVPTFFVEAVMLLMERALFAKSQRAEYIADATGALIGGSQAAVSSLKLTMRDDLVRKALLGLVHDGRAKTPVFQTMAAAATGAGPEALRAIDEEAAQTLLAVDNTHPPTLYRVKFLQAVGAFEAAIEASAYDWNAIDHELSDPFETAEAPVRRAFELH